MAESSSICLSKSALKRNMTWARSGTGVSLQAGKAFLAAATAPSIFSPVEGGGLAVVWPVARVGVRGTLLARQAREQPEHLGGRGGDQFDEAVERDPAGIHAAVEDQREAVFHAG